MNEFNPLLKIRFDGDAVGPGNIPVSHLLIFLSNLNKALQRTGRVLTTPPDRPASRDRIFRLKAAARGASPVQCR